MKPWERAAQEQAAQSAPEGPQKPWEKARQEAGGRDRYKGTILPFSVGPDGSARFDSDAGVLGYAKRVLSIGRDAIDGNLDLEDRGPKHVLEPDPTIERVTEAAGAVTPVTPGVRNMVKPGRPEVPTHDELKAAASRGYRAVENSGVDYDVKSVVGAAQQIKAALDKGGFREKNAGQAHSILNDLISPPSVPGARTVADIGGIVSARKAAARVARTSADATEREAAARVVRELDVYIQRTGPKSAVAGPAAEAGKAYGDANKNYAAAKRSEKLRDGPDSAEARGDLNASVANSGANTGNAIRQRLASILKSRKDRQGFSPDEIAGIDAAARGGIASNGLRNVGNALSGYGTMAGAVVGGAQGGVEGGLAGILAGQVAGRSLKAGSTALTRRALRKVDEQSRMRSPLYRDRLANPPMTPVTTGRAAALARALALIEAEERARQQQ